MARHRAQRTHAAIALVAPTLEQFEFAWSLFGAGEQRAEHDGFCPGGDGLDDIAAVRDASVGDDWNAQTTSGDAGEVDSRKLRHAGT